MSESQSSVSGTELGTLIDAFEREAVRFSDADMAWNDDELDTWQLEEAQKALSASRLSLEEYVRRLQEENQFEIVNPLDGEVIPVSAGTLVAELRAQLASLRSSALTPEEAWAILDEDLTDRPDRSAVATSAVNKCVGIVEASDAARSLSTLEETK